MKIAIISDIHGNSFALGEVLNHVSDKKIDAILNLGDSLYGPLDPVGTFRLIQSGNIISISGNQDRNLLENLDRSSGIKTMEYVKDQLSQPMIEWLKSLQNDYVYENNIYCCHGSPQSDMEYLVEDLKEGFINIKAYSKIDKMVESIEQNIVLCGHSHVARHVNTGKNLIINAGSVGLPAYVDDEPIYHRMENYSPHTTYTILELTPQNRKIERIYLEYDFEKAAWLAQKNGREDWAYWIRYGIVKRNS